MKQYAGKKDNDPRIDELLALRRCTSASSRPPRPVCGRCFAGEDLVAGLEQPGLGSRGLGQRGPAGPGRRLVGGETHETGERRLPAHAGDRLRGDGQDPKALENLRRAAAVRGERIEDADWYVLGRIAEQYGVDEVAAGLYRKVPTKQVLAADEVDVLGAAEVEEAGEVTDLEHEDGILHSK